MRLQVFLAASLLLSGRTAAEGSAVPAAPAAAPAPALVPWPSNLTLMGGPGAVLTSHSKILFASVELAGAAQVLAEDLAALHKSLALTPSSGTTAGPGDILLVLGPPPPPPPPPAPVPPPPPPPPPGRCATTAKTQLNATNWADHNGPRTAADAGTN